MSTPASARRRILIIDDDPCVRGSLQKILYRHRDHQPRWMHGDDANSAPRQDAYAFEVDSASQVRRA